MTETRSRQRSPQQLQYPVRQVRLSTGRAVAICIAHTWSPQSVSPLSDGVDGDGSASLNMTPSALLPILWRPLTRSATFPLFSSKRGATAKEPALSYIMTETGRTSREPLSTYFPADDHAPMRIPAPKSAMASAVSEMSAIFERDADIRFKEMMSDAARQADPPALGSTATSDMLHEASPPTLCNGRFSPTPARPVISPPDMPKVPAAELSLATAEEVWRKHL